MFLAVASWHLSFLLQPQVLSMQVFLVGLWVESLCHKPSSQLFSLSKLPWVTVPLRLLYQSTHKHIFSHAKRTWEIASGQNIVHIIGVRQILIKHHIVTQWHSWISAFFIYCRLFTLSAVWLFECWQTLYTRAGINIQTETDIHILHGNAVIIGSKWIISSYHHSKNR